MGRGRGRVDFEVDTEIGQLATAETANFSCTIDVGRPSLTVLIENKPKTWYFDEYPRRELALEVMQIIKAMIDAGSYFDTFANYQSYRLSLGSILSNINRHDPSGRVVSVTDMDRDFFDVLDQKGMGTAAWKRLCQLILVVRAARTFDPASVAEDLISPLYGDRLAYVSQYDKPTATPRDSYSPYVADQIRAAARCDIVKATDRVREGIKRFRSLESQLSSRPEALETFTPAERAIIRLATTGKVDFALYERELKEAGLRRVHTNHLRKASDFPENLALLAADLLAAGFDQKETEIRLDLPPLSIGHLLANDETFITMVEDAEDRALDQLREDILIDRKAREGRLVEYALNAVTLGRTRGQQRDRKDRLGVIAYTDDQVRRRLSVLRAWTDEIPREKLGTLNFTIKSVENWDDPELGIAPIGRLNQQAPGRLKRPSPLMSRYAHHYPEFESLLTDLADQYGRDFYKGYIRKVFAKIEVLEDWILTEMPKERVEAFVFTIEFFKLWADKDLGVEHLNQVASTTTHPRYGRFIHYADALLQGLRCQCRQRGLLSRRTADGPSTFKDDVTRPSVFGPTLCPTQDELAAFLAQLGLMCKIDLGSLKELRRDCLIGAAHGKVGIRYIKKRPRPTKKVDWERDGSIETPGGLIRRVLALTEVAHEALKSAGHPDADKLWLGYFNSGIFKKCSFIHPVDHPWWKFCERHQILDDDRKRLDAILPSRFRKTVKAEKYRKRNGDLYSITDDHSPAVARNHYANLPSLEELHDDAVDRGLRRALDDVTSRVFPDESTPGAAERLSEMSGESVELCEAVLAGDEDTWLAGCMGFHKSPFGKPGEPCPTPFTECIHCSNSIFVSRKLPNLLRFRRWLYEHREVMSDLDWKTLYAKDLARIELQILPRFTKAQREKAEEIIASDSDQDPLFIPAFIRATV
jgi:hypothetical protein